MLKLRVGHLKGRSAAFLLVVIVFALALAAACGDDEAKTGVVKIGSISSFSGDLVSVGEPHADGVRLAVREINEAGGFQVGDTIYTLELVESDDRSDPAAGVAAATELIRDEQVQFIFGPIVDTFSVLIQELTNPEKIIMMAGSTIFGTMLTNETAGPGGDLHYLFKSFPADKTRQDVTARATKELLPNAEFQVLYIPNDVIGQTISETWLEGFKQVGEADALLYPSGTTDFAPFLTTTKATNPDVIHFWHTPPEEINALEQAIELDAAPTYLLHAVDPETYVERFPALDVPVLLLCIPLCAGVTSSDTAASFFDRYRTFLGADLPIAAGVALLIYDYVFMLTAAMEEAGTVTDTDAIVAALEDLTYEGVLGTLKFDERHIVEHGFDICTTVGTIECEFYPPLG